MKTLTSRKSQDGIALVLTAIAAVALLGIAGLALEMGLSYITMSRVQNALDAAALGGAKVLSATGNVDEAEAAALADFDANMDADLDLDPVVEMSDTLVPFVAGGANPKYVRVSVEDVPATLQLAKVLDGVEDFEIASSAVAGTITLGGDVCNSIPVMFCGSGTDADCSDGACFGYTTGTDVDLVIRSGDDIGPGNYQMLASGTDCGTGANCMRKALAGGTACFDPDGDATTEPGTMNNIVQQGINTRFGQYQGGGMTSAQYPPDVITSGTHDAPLYYSNYSSQLAAGPPYPRSDGVPGRRVVVVPIGDCSVGGSGRTEWPLLGAACFFLTHPVQNDGQIHGQLISTCQAGGTPGEDPPESGGPTKIILYKDPDSDKS